MKRIAIVAVLVLMFAASGSAETQKLFKGYLMGGVALPQSDFEDGYKMGYQGGGRLGLNLMPMLEPCAFVGYNYFPLDVDAWGLPDGYEIDGGEVKLLTYGVELKVNFGSSESGGLYAIGGFGIAKIDMNEITISDGNSEGSQNFEIDDMEYLTLGAGVDFGSMFLEARYVKLTDDIVLEDVEEEITDKAGVIYIPISVGFRF